MDKMILSQMKNLNREERMEFLKGNKSVLLDGKLSAVNGGTDGEQVENPNSESIPYKGNWLSSDGYVCNGEVIC